MKTFVTVLALAAVVPASTGCATAGAREQGASGSFDARLAFSVTPPEGARTVRCWFAMPQSDPDQQVSTVAVSAPHAWSIVPDDLGNWFLYVEAKGPGLRPFEVVEEFRLTRREMRTRPDPASTRPLTEAERREMTPFLAANAQFPVDDEWRRLAREITGGDPNPVSAARKLYDWTLANVEYWVKHPDRLKASPVGSAEYCRSSGTGNCTDFHSLWTALARSAGIPTRMVYGSFFKKGLEGKDADQSYHCWIEFWAPGLGWIPHDVAIADLYTGGFEITRDNEERVRLTTADGSAGADLGKVEYYFGNIDSRRVVWHRGRDLRPEPGPAAGPVNALPKAYVEADGTPLTESTGWTRKLTFTEIR